ncbi:MAG TPA: hypothetical protein VMY78_05700 [Solirubrobacteraceae bacterium]|nr:hypothetical protein [Solirubrobacteraceae bacterium]
MAQRKDKDAPKGDDGAAAISIAAHPRSAGAVRRAKGWGGLLGLVLGTNLALGAHIPLEDALLRGLAGGVCGYLALWAIAVAVARQLVIAEVRARYAEVVAAAAASSPEG